MPGEQRVRRQRPGEVVALHPLTAHLAQRPSSVAPSSTPFGDDLELELERAAERVRREQPLDPSGQALVEQIGGGRSSTAIGSSASRRARLRGGAARTVLGSERDVEAALLDQAQEGIGEQQTALGCCQRTQRLDAATAAPLHASHLGW